jgi:hypothetical protein
MGFPHARVTPGSLEDSSFWIREVYRLSHSKRAANVRFGWWSQAVDATLYFRRKRWNGRAMGRRYVRGFNTVAKEELCNPLALRIRSSTEWLGNSMNGGVRLWASKPEPNEI